MPNSIIALPGSHGPRMSHGTSMDSCHACSNARRAWHQHATCYEQDSWTRAYSIGILIVSPQQPQISDVGNKSSYKEAFATYCIRPLAHGHSNRGAKSIKFASLGSVCRDWGPFGISLCTKPHDFLAIPFEKQPEMSSVVFAKLVWALALALPGAIWRDWGA